MSDVSKLSREEEEVKERQIDREEKTPTSKVGEAETTADQIKVYAWNRTRDPSLRRPATPAPPSLPGASHPCLFNDQINETQVSV